MLPDGAEYWQDLKRHFSRLRTHEPKYHKAGAAGDALCGVRVQPDRLRKKKSKVTCRNCLALISRFVVAHEVEGQSKILHATDDEHEARRVFEQAQGNNLQHVRIQIQQHVTNPPRVCRVDSETQ